MAFLSGLFDTVNDIVMAPIKLAGQIATAPIRAVASALAPSGVKVKATSAAKGAKANATQILRPAEAPAIAQKRAQLSIAASAAEKGPRAIIRPLPTATDAASAQALAFLRAALTDVLEGIGEKVGGNTIALDGLSTHVEAIEKELLGRIAYLETGVVGLLKGQVEAIRHVVEDQGRMGLAAAREVAVCLIEMDPDITSTQVAAFKSQLEKAETYQAVAAVWADYRKASASLWNRMKASAPAWLTSVAITGLLDFRTLGASRNVRLAVVLDAVVAMVLGKSRPEWLVAGAVPVITLLNGIFQIPLSATATVRLEGSITETQAGGPPGAQVLSGSLFIQGIPDLFVPSATSFTITEARLESDDGSYRLKLGQTTLSAEELVQGKSIPFTLGRAQIITGDVSPAGVTVRLAGGNRGSSGNARETVATSPERINIPAP